MPQCTSSLLRSIQSPTDDVEVGTIDHSNRKVDIKIYVNPIKAKLDIIPQDGLATVQTYSLNSLINPATEVILEDGRSLSVRLTCGSNTFDYTVSVKYIPIDSSLLPPLQVIVSRRAKSKIVGNSTDSVWDKDLGSPTSSSLTSMGLSAGVPVGAGAIPGTLCGVQLIRTSSRAMPILYAFYVVFAFIPLAITAAL